MSMQSFTSFYRTRNVEHDCKLMWNNRQTGRLALQFKILTKKKMVKINIRINFVNTSYIYSGDEHAILEMLPPIY